MFRRLRWSRRPVRLPVAASEVVPTAPANPAVDALVACVQRSIRELTLPPRGDDPADDPDPEFRKVYAVAARLLKAGYRLGGPLGKGTYGVVFRAEQLSTGKAVAIKFFAHGSAAELRDLTDEVRQLRRLDGVDGLVHLHDACPESDPPYFVMEFAGGGSLDGRLREGGAVPPAEAVRLVRRVADTLAAMHQKGVIHCDLKPANILLRESGRPVVADFGQAKLSGDLKPALGTFYYMPPEQAETGRPQPDTRWDVHALGAVLYELLTGRVPRHDDTLSGQLSDKSTALPARLKRYRQAVTAAPAPTAHRRVPGVDRALARLVDRCLAADPQARYPNAGAVVAAFRDRDRRRRERPLLAGAAALTLLVPAVVAGVGGWAVEKARAQGTQTAAALARQDEEVNELFARTAATALRQALDERVGWLQGQAADDELRWDVARAAAAARRGGYPYSWAEAQRFRSFLDARYPAGRRLFPNGMAVVAAADGRAVMLAQVGHDPGTGRLVHWGETPDGRESPDEFLRLQKNWAFRDWFSGGGNKDEAAAGGYPPVAGPQVSQPYASKQNGKVLVDVTVPVYPPNAPPGVAPAGVLVAGIPVDQFLHLIEERFATADRGYRAVLGHLAFWVGNERGHYVWHHALKPADGPPADPGPLGLTDPNPVPHLAYFLKRFRAATGPARPDAADPLGAAAGGAASVPPAAAPTSQDLTADRLGWADPLETAAAARVPTAAARCTVPSRADNDEWVVVVQRTDYKPPHEAVEDTHRRLWTAQAVTLALIAGLAAVCWGWLLRLLRRSADPA